MEENNTNTIEIKDKSKEIEQNFKKTCDFLNELYKNVQMGKLSFEYLLPRIKDTELKDELLSQFNDFEAMSTKISSALIKLGKTPNSSLGLAKPMLKRSISLTLMFNSSTNKIADMITQGDNQGIMDINRLINATTGKVSENAISLARELLELEQRHIDKLKKWL